MRIGNVIVKPIGMIIISAMLFMSVTAAVSVYMEGRAKSNWLKQTKGIDIPWYEAAFLEDVTGNQDLNLNIK